MRRIVFQAAVAGFLLSPAPALAQNANALSGFYVGLFGGATYIFDQEVESGASEVDIEYDFPGYVIGGQIGYVVDTNIRIEAEISYMSSDGDATLEVAGVEIVDAGYDYTQLSGTAGVFFDLWPVGSSIPYVGAGIGYARAENEVNDIDDDQNAFTAYGEGGVPFTLTPEISIVPAIRFSWVATDEDVDELFADNLYNTQFRLGARYAF
ncbi:MAG: porin family protein [Geminicoccaceae bacterium]